MFLFEVSLSQLRLLFNLPAPGTVFHLFLDTSTADIVFNFSTLISEETCVDLVLSKFLTFQVDDLLSIKL